MGCHGGTASSKLQRSQRRKISTEMNHGGTSEHCSHLRLYSHESLLCLCENGKVKKPPVGFRRTGHMGEHVSIHCPQAVSTERQLRKLGQVPEHIRWQVLQLVVPQVELLIEESAHSSCGMKIQLFL